MHHRLGLPDACAVYDVSNACLGLLNGMVQVANMIELGQISRRRGRGHRKRPGAGRERRSRTSTPTRRSRANDIKPAFASLTIGSGSAAIVLCDRELSRTGNRLLGGVIRTTTEHCELCQGGPGTTRPTIARRR